MNLASAVANGNLRDEIKRYAGVPRTESGLATYRAVGLCACGIPVPIALVARWNVHGPALLSASVGSADCPGCGAVLTLADVTFIGIRCPGWPAFPATGTTLEDLYFFLEERKRVPPVGGVR